MPENSELFSTVPGLMVWVCTGTEVGIDDCSDRLPQAEAIPPGP
jgi:hypothetical protein